MAMLNNPRVVPFFGATVNPHEQTDPRTAPDGGTVRGAVREKRLQGLRRCSRLSRRLERSGMRSPNPAGTGCGKRGKANFNRGKGGFNEEKLGDITGIQWDIMSCAIYIYIYISDKYQQYDICVCLKNWALTPKLWL